MDHVFMLWHVHEFEDGDDEKLIGVYRSEQNAERAIQRLKDKPGFRNHPEGFQIHRCELDRDEWEEGFVTVA